QHLGVPIVARKRPAVAENNRLARTPVLVEDLRAIGRSDRAHVLLPPLVWPLTPKPANWQRNNLARAAAASVVTRRTPALLPVCGESERIAGGRGRVPEQAVNSPRFRF